MTKVDLKRTMCFVKKHGQQKKGELTMFVKQELKSVLAKYDDRQEDLANALGITPALLSARINGKIEFRRNEIELIITRYKLSQDDVRRIFFAPDVSLEETMLN